MPTYSGRSAGTAFGRQTAEGTALTTPRFEIPMGGGFAGPERAIGELPFTNDTQDRVGDFVERVGGVVDMTIPVLPVSSVGALEAVLGTRSTTGAGPFTHALTPADTLPFSTFYYDQPGDNYWQVVDTKIGAATLSWSPGSPLELAISGAGKTVTRSATRWTAATLVEAIEPFFTYIGATMNFESSTTPATTRVRNIGSGSVAINRNLEQIQTDALTFGYNAENKREIEISLDDVVFEDNNLINTIFTGSTTGTTLSGTIVYGSCDFLFLGSDQAASTTRSLRIAVPRVMWTVDTVPPADPAGSTVRYTVTGRAAKPTTGASITVTVINGSAGTVY